MENQKNNKVVITILIIIIIILSILCLLIATDSISFKSNNIENHDKLYTDNNNDKLNSNIDDINTEQEIIETVKITNLTFEKPYASGFGGGDINTLMIDTFLNLDCSNDLIAGIRLSGYCLDTKENKYMMSGPIEVMTFYCDNNPNHTDLGHMTVDQVFDSNGNEIATTNTNWKEIEIKSCKIDKAQFVHKDGLILATEQELNYEKEF